MQIQLENDSKELERNVKKRKEESESDAQMKKQQQTARNVARKKSELQAKLDTMREKRKKLIGDDGLDATAADVNAKQQPMSEDEKKRVVEVADTYKTLKRQMDETNAELLTLTQTEERVKEEEREAAKALEEAKQRAGFSGAAKPEPEVPDVSQKKASAEEEKDSEMDMSAAVKEIHNTIEARKGELQPKMEALRARREQFKELEAEHTEAKREYTSHKSSHESKRAKLERTVTSLRSDTAEKERKYHELEARSATADAEVQQATCEHSQQSLVEQLQAQVARDEEVLSELEARSGFLDESVGRFSAQKQMLGDLKMLLDARKASAASTESIGETFRVGESDVLAL
jgi:chromosome segregation ATPase